MKIIVEANSIKELQYLLKELVNLENNTELNNNNINESLDSLDLSMRAINALRMLGVKTISELCNIRYIELLKLEGVGKITFNEIRTKLQLKGLRMLD